MPRIFLSLCFVTVFTVQTSAQEVNLNVTDLSQLWMGTPFGENIYGNLLRLRLITYKTWLDEKILLGFKGDVEYLQGNKNFTNILNYAYLFENDSYALPLQQITYSKNYSALFMRVFRLYLKFNLGNFTLKAGRQSVDWGRGYFFFPLNPFTPTVNLSAEPSQVPGVDGVLISFYATDFLSAEAVWGVKNKKNMAGTRLKGFWRGVDFSLLGWWDEENFSGGGSLAFNLLRGLMRVEVLIPRKMFNLLIGYDISPGEGFDMTLEYYLNLSEGKSSPEDYPIHRINFPSDLSELPSYMDSLAETFFKYAPLTGKLGRHYLALLVSKSLGFPITLSFAFEANLSDDSYLFMPLVKWEVFRWLELTTGAILGTGREKSEFHVAGKNAFLLVEMFF